MIDQLPQYVNKESRQGHNLTHDFSFSSSTGHLLTLFGCRMDPKDTIQGRIDMFSRTQPLTQAANVEIEEFIDYFFVPNEMLYSGMGDYVYQVNEPYSSVTHAVLASQAEKLPLLNWVDWLDNFATTFFHDYVNGDETVLGINVTNTGSDEYGLDNAFFSAYRNLFHNYYNPNALFKYVADRNQGDSTDYVFPSDYFQPNVFPIYLLAYNCIYQHFYRLDDREPFDPSQYNIDATIYNGSTIEHSLNLGSIGCRYRPRFFDYFTSVKVAPLINGNNILRTGQSTVDLTRINNYLNSQQVSLSKPGGGSPSELVETTQVRSSLLTSSGLRSMFAVEKLLSITNRSKKTYDAQVLAHLGVDMPTDYYHNIQYLGTQKSTIKIGEVVATASTEQSPLGDIAGKGYSVMGDKGVKFTAPCHGVFMAIYSAVPKVRYYAPLEKHAMITDRLSFYHPEYARLGMQPLFGYEAFAAPIAGEYAANTATLGWQMRYAELKSRFNKVSPAFVDTIIDSTQRPFGGYEQSFNDWHTWLVVERPFGAYANFVTTDLRDYLANPYMLNGLMSVQYLRPQDWMTAYLGTGFYLFEEASELEHHSFARNVASLFKRDPLLHFAKCDFKIVNKIPENTLPALNVM